MFSLNKTTHAQLNITMGVSPEYFVRIEDKVSVHHTVAATEKHGVSMDIRLDIRLEI